jgi:hypothetical protein
MMKSFCRFGPGVFISFNQAGGKVRTSPLFYKISLLNSLTNVDGLCGKFVGNSPNHWRKPVGFDATSSHFSRPGMTRRRRRVMPGAEVEIVAASPLAYTPVVDFNHPDRCG